MITYSDFQFATAPGTSHAWILEAIKCAQYPVQMGNSFQVHQPFPEDYLFHRLTCVRHPEAWLSAVYNDGRGLSVSGATPVTELCKLAKSCDSFAEFVEDIILKYPGAVGKSFSIYRATSVIREEDLPWSLIGFLSLMKEVPEGTFHQIVSLPIPGRGENKMRVLKRQPEELSLKLYRRLMDSESDYCDRYEYY